MLILSKCGKTVVATYFHPILIFVGKAALGQAPNLVHKYWTRVEGTGSDTKALASSIDCCCKMYNSAVLIYSYLFIIKYSKLVGLSHPDTLI